MAESQQLFASIVSSFTHAVENNLGDGLASLFTKDGCYSDGFYGDFHGREAISGMLSDHFWGHAQDFKWVMSDLTFAAGHGYAQYVFSYTSKLPSAEGKRIVFEGISHFQLHDDLIYRYQEVFNTGVAMAQLNFDKERIHRHLEKKAALLREKVNLD